MPKKQGTTIFLPDLSLDTMIDILVRKVTGKDKKTKMYYEDKEITDFLQPLTTTSTKIKIKKIHYNLG